MFFMLCTGTLAKSHLPDSTLQLEAQRTIGTTRTRAGVHYVHSGKPEQG